MAESKRPQNNTIEFLTKLTKLFQSGPRIRHKIPKDITGKRSPEVMNALHSGQYLSNRDPYIYNQADRFYRYEDFAIMEFTPIIAAALDVYASAVASLDENRRSIVVRSKNPKIKAILYSLFMDIMNLNVNLYPWARNLVKYGDFFTFLRIDPNHGIIGVEPIPMDGIERVEKIDPQTGESEVIFKVNLNGVGELKSHQVAHFRLPFNDQFAPYGTSILDPARKIWRMLCFLPNSAVWTPDGYREVRDLQIGDEVYAYTNGVPITTKVKNVWPTGKKNSWEVSTQLNTLVTSAEHRFLVVDSEGKESYVCASELNASIHRLVCPVLNDDTLADRRSQIYRTFQGANVAFFPTKSESIEFLTLCQKSGIPGYKINDTCIGILRSVPVYDDVHYEEIVSVVSLDQESEMYDIEVEHEVHNFVANGIVTHNCLLEDAMMVYRIVRAPERRIFKIDVGNIPPESVEAFMEEQQNRMRRQIVVDDSTGRLDLRYSALSLESDYFVPVRGNVGTEIDTLQGGTWSDGIQDIEYLQANLFAALRVPKPYLNFMDSADSSKTALTEMSIIFSDHVRRIQHAIINELNKVAMIHLMFFGFDDEDMMDFELDLASSSRLAQQQTMEIYRQKFEILSGAPEDIPRRLLYKKIMGWDDDDIEEMTQDKIKEAKLMGILKKLSDGDFEAAAGGMGGFGGGGFDSGGGGGDFDLGGGDDLGGDTGEDLGGGGDDLGGDLGGDTGGEALGGSGGAESEVEDLFQGPFDPKGKSVFRTNDDVEDFERRRNQAQDILRQAIAVSPMDFLIHGNPEDDEDGPKKDRHGRTKGEPIARRTQDRERAPGAGRPIEPGHSARITGKDRHGTGRRHVNVSTGNNSTSTRYHNDLIKPDKDAFRVAQESRAGLSKEYKDALNSLSKSLGKNALLEAGTGIDDLDAALSSWSSAQKDQEATNNGQKDGEMKKGAGIPPKKSLSPSELRQQRALSDEDKAVKDALTKVQRAVADKDKDKTASTETTEEEPETTTVKTKTTITSSEG